MKIVSEVLKRKGDTCIVAKKGKKYIGWEAGELAKVDNAMQAIAFASESEAERIIGELMVDDRNAKVIGKSYGLCPLTRNQ